MINNHGADPDWEFVQRDSETLAAAGHLGFDALRWIRYLRKIVIADSS